MHATPTIHNSPRRAPRDHRVVGRRGSGLPAAGPAGAAERAGAEAGSGCCGAGAPDALLRGPAQRAGPGELGAGDG